MDLTEDEEEAFDLLFRATRASLKGKPRLANYLRTFGIRRVRRMLQKEQSPELWTTLGELYIRRQHKRTCFERAHALAPSNVRALYLLADWEYRHGSLEKSVQLLSTMPSELPYCIAMLVYELEEYVYTKSGATKLANEASKKLEQWMREPDDMVCFGPDDKEWNETDPLEIERPDLVD